MLLLLLSSSLAEQPVRVSRLKVTKKFLRIACRALFLRRYLTRPLPLAFSLVPGSGVCIVTTLFVQTCFRCVKIRNGDLRG